MFYELRWLQILALTFLREQLQKIQKQINTKSLTTRRDGTLSHNYFQGYFCGSFVYILLNPCSPPFFLSLSTK